MTRLCARKAISARLGRRLAVVVALAGTLAAGCNLGPVVAPAGPGAPAPIESGSLVVKIRAGYRVQGLADIVAKVRFELTGPNVPAPSILEVPRERFSSGKVEVRWDRLLPGPVTIKAQVFDAGGSLIAKAEGDGTVVAGKAATLALDLELLGGSATLTFVPEDFGEPPAGVSLRFPLAPPGTWQAAAPLAIARAGHSAVVLDGKLYVIGGDFNNVIERFDAPSGTWQARVMPHFGLHDSLAGGAAFGNRIVMLGHSMEYLGSPDDSLPIFYDPEAIGDQAIGFVNTLNVASMQTRRYATAVVSDGARLFVLGGMSRRSATVPYPTPTPPPPVDLTLGVSYNLTTQADVLYRFRFPVESGKTYHIEAAKGDSILWIPVDPSNEAGAYNAIDKGTLDIGDHSEKYDFTSSISGKYPFKVSQYASSGSRNFTVLAKDVTASPTPSPTSIPLATPTPAPSAAPPTPTPSPSPGSAALDRLLGGGVAPRPEFMPGALPYVFLTFSLVEGFTASGQNWSVMSAMPTARAALGALLHGNKIYAAGGFRWQGAELKEKTQGRLGVDASGSAIVALDAFEVFDPDSDTWAARAALPTARFGLGLAASGGRIYAIGGAGSDGKALAVVESYDPEANTWRPEPSLPAARALVSAVTLPSGEILAIGGLGANGRPLRTVDAFNPGVKP